MKDDGLCVFASSRIHHVDSVGFSNKCLAILQKFCEKGFHFLVARYFSCMMARLHPRIEKFVTRSVSDSFFG